MVVMLKTKVSSGQKAWGNPRSEMVSDKLITFDTPLCLIKGLLTIGFP